MKKHCSMKWTRTIEHEEAISEVAKIAGKASLSLSTLDSRKKAYASVLMALHPRALTLGEIAEIANVPIGTLKVWRIDAKFRQAMEQAFASIGTKLARDTEASLDAEKLARGKSAGNDDRRIFPPEAARIVGILPYLNPKVTECFVDRAIDQAYQGKSRFLDVLEALHQSSVYLEDGRRREYESRPEILLAAKAILLFQVDELLRTVVENAPDEKTVEQAANSTWEVKNSLLGKLDVLSGGDQRAAHSSELINKMTPFPQGGKRGRKEVPVIYGSGA